MKRLIALCGIVFVLVTLFAVPVSALTIQGEPVAILTNSFNGMDYGEQFFLRTVDNVDPYTLTLGKRYYISDYNTTFDNGNYVVPTSSSPTLAMLVFATDIMDYPMNIELDYDSIDGGSYYLLTDQGLDGNGWYLGGANFPGTFTFYIYESANDNQYDSAYDEGFSDGYDEGYEEGKKDGQDLGYDEGYEEGKQDGLDEGFDKGYAEAIKDSSDNSWRSLFFGVIEAPVNVLMRLFDFEILGFNLTGLITAVFTLSIVLIVIKWVI